MKKVLATLAFVALTVTAAHAQVLAWDVTGHGTPFDASLAASTIDTGLATTAGLNALTRQDVVGANAGNSFNSSNWNTGAFAEGTNYITFTLTPGSGNQLNLTSLDYAINGSNTAPGTGQWGYSIGGGAFVTQTPFSLTQPAPVSLSTWDFTDFSTTSSVEFRFWAFGTTAINPTSTVSTSGVIRIANISGNDLVLNGSVSAVPEPSTIGLIGLGLVGVVAFAHRRWRKLS